MLTYAGPAGHTFIGHRLSLPKRWTDDPARCREAGIPASVGFATKLDQAVELLAEAVDAKVPFSWVTMDGGYGQYPQVRNWMAGQSLSYVVATCSALPLTQIGVAAGTVAITRADDLPARLADGDWQRRSCGEGSKGGRYYDWALIGLGGNLHVTDETPADGFAHTLLIRRSIADPTDITYFLAHARHPTPATTLIRVAGTRWKIEENNEQGKDLIGLSGSPGALLRRGPLRTGQARSPSIRLKQPPRAVGILRWSSCQSGAVAPVGRKRVSGGSVCRPAPAASLVVHRARGSRARGSRARWPFG
jgi:SRSO17 transposase